MSWTPPTIATPRLVLRPVTEADTDAIFAACSDPAVTEFTLFETHHTREASLAFVRTFVVPNYEQGVPDPLAIAWADAPQTLIGCAGGRWTDNRCNKCVEFGYWVSRPHWGRGVATEAVRALVPYLFAELKPERIQAHVMAPNAASARVLEKAGTTYEGTLRRAFFRRGTYWDVKMYSVLKEDVLSTD